MHRSRANRNKMKIIRILQVVVRKPGCEQQFGNRFPGVISIGRITFEIRHDVLRRVREEWRYVGSGQRSLDAIARVTLPSLKASAKQEGLLLALKNLI